MPSLKLREDNPYVKGKVLKFRDGRTVLERVPVTYEESGKDKFHIVRDFDTLESLAFLYYGNSKNWWIIADVNKTFFPFELPIGTSIIIPDLDKIKIQI